MMSHLNELMEHFISNTAAGHTLMNYNIRRKPNAFNFLHQCELMVASGMTGDSSLQSLDAGFSAADPFSTWEAQTVILKHISAATAVYSGPGKRISVCNSLSDWKARSWSVC